MNQKSMTAKSNMSRKKANMRKQEGMMLKKSNMNDKPKMKSNGKRRKNSNNKRKQQPASKTSPGQKQTYASFAERLQAMRAQVSYEYPQRMTVWLNEVISVTVTMLAAYCLQ